MFRVRARRWSRTFVAMVALGACSLVAAFGSAAPAGAAVDPSLLGGVFAAMNGDRAANGLPALGWNDNLAAFAQNWAQWMAANMSLTHQDLMTILNSGGYSWVGENILAGGASLTASQAETMWMG